MRRPVPVAQPPRRGARGGGAPGGAIRSARGQIRREARVSGVRAGGGRRFWQRGWGKTTRGPLQGTPVFKAPGAPLDQSAGKRTGLAGSPWYATNYINTAVRASQTDTVHGAGHNKWTMYLLQSSRFWPIRRRTAYSPHYF